MTNMDTMPRSDVDLFSEEVMDDPYPVYRQLRDAGPVVYLEGLDVWAVARYEQARHVLGDWEAFSSADLALNDQFNQYIGDGVIRAAPPLHTRLRKVLAAQLAPRAMRDLRPDIAARAKNLVDNLVDQGSFDAVTDLARRFPLDLVADLIGLPQSGRERLIDLVDANFNCFGPDNARTRESGPKLGELAGYVMANARPDALAEGSMGRAIFDAVDAGKVDAADAPWLVMTYVVAGVDTTVHAISNAIWLLGQHPDQWDSLRADTALIPQAFREVLRYESPVQMFGRTATVDWAVDGITVPADSRLLVLFGSANRDERKWDDPDRFDIRRTGRDHLAFGYGPHRCAGEALADVEGESILSALAENVTRIEVGQPVRHYNNVLRGLESLPVTVATQ